MEKPKLKIFNRDGSITEVEPLPMWSPCRFNDEGFCIVCGRSDAEGHEVPPKGEDSNGQ